MEPPKISVITVSYNQGEFIRENIESVLAQQYPNVEHIIIDGGSTDDTVSILKSYPHLIWTSRPDRGQSDALNQGFARATGEIIAWLNSDDWYAPNVFHDVVRALEHNEIAFGGAATADRNGKTTEEVPNFERTWFDLLKYWVYYAVPAQPAVFFRKSLLEKVKRPDGSYLDEDLFYAMDYELWLRMLKHATFSNRIPRTVAFTRMYDTNKTGSDMPGVYRELSRAFKRHEKTLGLYERPLSVVIPTDPEDPHLERTLHALKGQSLKHFEIILLSVAADRASARALAKKARELDADFAPITVRAITTQAGSYYAALREVVHRLTSPFMAVLRSGDQIAPQFTYEALNAFIEDRNALLLLATGQSEIDALLFQRGDAEKRFNPLSAFTMPPFRIPFIARRAAMLDSEAFHETEELLSMRQCILATMNCGWRVFGVDALMLTGHVRQEISTDNQDLAAVFTTLLNAELVVRAAELQAKNEFGRIRVKHGFSVLVPEAQVNASKAQLTQSPPEWRTLLRGADLVALQETVERFPNFIGGWYLLAKTAAEKQDGELARAALARFRQLSGSLG